MKKLLVLLILTMAICSSAFAECNLDMNRWKPLVLTDNYGLYFDTASIDVNNADASFNVWECEYFSGNNTKCIFGICARNGLQSSEHYHYILTEYNYKHRTVKSKSATLRDGNGKILLTHDYPLHSQPTRNIVPDTLFETVMLEIKDYIDSTTDSKSGAKVEPLFPIVINNAKKEDVKKEIYQNFKNAMAAPSISSSSPVISEDNEKITLTAFSKDNGISFEWRWIALATQQGKNVIVNGEANVTSHYPDGKIVGPNKNPAGEDVLFFAINSAKKRISGYYRFGYVFEINAEGYYVITKLAPGYPFEKKGIKVGDIMLSINGKQLKGLPIAILDKNRIRDPFSPDEKIFEIKHNGVTKQYTIKPKFVTPEELKKEKQKKTKA